MSFQRKKITYTDYSKILTRAEAQLIDFKNKLIKPSKICDSISAFANAEGGEVFVGISEPEPRKMVWDGFQCEEEANAIVEVVENMLFLNCHYSAEFLEYLDKGLVLRLIINKSGKVIYTPAKNIFRRRNAQNLRLKTPEEIRGLELSKGVISHEDFETDAKLSEISNSNVVNGFIISNNFEVEPESFLRKNNLVGSNNKPRVSGLLLFGDYPQAYINRSEIKIIQYNTSSDIAERNDMVGKPLTIEGCIYEMIYGAVEKIEEILHTLPMTEQGEHMVYPRETLHEIIANAVLHRDYSIQEVIQIRIFNNRVEIESPGILAGQITIRNVLNQRYSRNGSLVRIINKFENPPNKDIGEGLNTAFDAMRRSGLMPPEIKQKENSVLVIIPSERLPDSTVSFLALLKNHEELTIEDINRKRIFRTFNERKRILAKLVKEKTIEQVPYTFGADTAYRLSKSEKQAY
jgi:ATP-dependent DNA helicase RecG